MSKQRTAQLSDILGVLKTSMDRHVLVEEFLQRPILNADVVPTDEAPTQAEMALRFAANRNWEVLGTAATSESTTHAAGGGVALTTGTTANNQAIITPQLDAGQTSWATTNWNSGASPSFGVALRTHSAVDETIYWAGLKLTNTSTTETDDDQAFFRYQDGVNGGNWQCIVSAGGVDHVIDSGVPVEAGRDYRLEFSVDDTRVVRFYIDGQHVATGNPLAADKSLIPYVGVQTTNTTASVLTARRVVCVRDFG